MGTITSKLNYLSSISQNFVHKPNPYVPDDQRQSIRFKEAIAFGLLVGSTALITAKAFKGYRSKTLTGMIAFNIIGSGVIGLWMLRDVNELAKKIPMKEIEARLNSGGEKERSGKGESGERSK